jgi:hypothetical protein
MPPERNIARRNEPAQWRDWLLAAWTAGIFAFFLRSVIEILS